MELLYLSNLTPKTYQENDNDILFEVEAINPPKRCIQCGFTELYKHSKRKQLIMDLPIRLKRVGLSLTRRRYKCRTCNATFWEPLEALDEKRNMTTRLVEGIITQSMTTTFVEVAELVGVDEKTVRNIFKDYVAEKEATHVFETPRFLGIDEIHITGKPRLIMTNVERRTVYDMKPDRNKETVIKRLLQIEDRDYIEYVSIDMWKPYKDAVNAVMPEAKVVVDKFHVVRMANQAVDSVRKKLKDEMTPKQRRQLMRERYLLLYRNKELTPEQQFNLDVWLGNVPGLKEAYELKEAFYEIWDTDNSTEGFERYLSWRERCIKSDSYSAYKDLVRAVDNWHEEIFNYFDKRLTNAYTESLNSIIRQIDRKGRGHSFEVLRAKILFNESLHKKRKPRFNKKSFGLATYRHETGIDRFIRTDNWGVDFSTFIKILEKGEL